MLMVMYMPLVEISLASWELVMIKLRYALLYVHLIDLPLLLMKIKVMTDFYLLLV